MINNGTTDNEQLVVFTYINYRGEVSKRVVRPANISFTSNKWHSEKQWILSAYDLDKKERRDFAIKDIKKWRPYNGSSY